MEGPTLRSSMSLAIVCSYLRTLYPKLTLDGFEDVLNRELQRGEAVIHPVGSEWALLRVRDWLLLENTLPTTLIVDGGDSILRL